MTPARTIELIRSVLSGQEWSADTPQAIASILTEAGYTIEEPRDIDDEPTDAPAVLVPLVKPEGSQNFLVKWSIELSANSAHEAAQAARDIQLDPYAMVGCFEVVSDDERGGEGTMIDLDTEDEDDEVDDGEPDQWRIRRIDETVWEFWNDEDGWGSWSTATRYSTADRKAGAVVMGGAWVDTLAMQRIMDRTYIIDGHEVVTLEQIIDANIDDPELVFDVRNMSVHQSLTFGGGAAGVRTIVRTA